MDTETLQQLITMVGSAGEGAFTLVCIYFVTIMFTKLTLAAVFIALIVAAYKIARGFLNQSEIITIINSRLGTNYTLPLYGSEIASLRAKLDRMES